ncbi:2-thiouracil desulfurase family protein [Pseudomonas sp. Marseille-QA0892]
MLAKILVSRCLLGQRVRYDGGAHGPFDLLAQWHGQGRVVPLCPEVFGGLPTPRAPAEIPGGQGADVLDGKRPVLTDVGDDVTGAFVRGANEALQLVEQYGIRIALLKARSPSCGNDENYDGTFSGTRVAGEGVTAAALKRQGVVVFNESQFAEAAALLAQLDNEDR